MSSENNNRGHVLGVKRHEYTENLRDVNQPISTSNVVKVNEETKKKKVTIEVDEDDPCLKDKEKQEVIPQLTRAPGSDPRFQQQNQTLRCWVMYTDFYRCEHILGAGSDACTWFKQVFTSICPNDWIRHWDELRVNGKFAWHKYRTQGDFPGTKYGV